ncbi:MAG: DUF1329 domain-containing protein [Bdellovibrionales bacterium]|nr:DUF1329 domain-containing protein [Bdellovibrionales bacterium]
MRLKNGRSTTQPMRRSCSYSVRRVCSELLVLLLAVAQPVYAEDAAPESTAGIESADVAQATSEGENSIPLPKGVPPIPAPDDSGAKLFVSSQNVSLFHEILIAPLAAWLKESKLIIRVVRELNFAWTYLPPWDGSAGDAAYSLRSDRSLLPKENPPKPGFPFGNAQVLDKENDPEVKAYKILWNTAFAKSISQALLYDLDLSWVGSQSLLRYSTGGLFRYYPPAAEQQSAENQFMEQEVFQLLDPPVVFGFSSLSWRYLSADEDQMWIYSPVTGKVRTLLSSNRSDNLVGSIVTSDDVFVWSGKVQAFNAKVVGERVLLAPFPSLRMYDVSQSESFTPGIRVIGEKESETEASAGPEGETAETKKEVSAPVVRAPYQTRTGTPSMVLWNHQSRRLPQAAPWAPVSVFFVPRNFWILELSPRDPFYSSGRMILAVDKESMLPFYKVVYDRDGSLLKTVIGSWGLARESELTPRFPFAAFVLVVHAKENSVSSLTSQHVAVFPDTSKLPPELLAMLDIQNYISTEEKSKEKK